MNKDKQTNNVLYIHEHYDWDNNKYFTCRDAKCYQKLLEQKKALEEYQFQVDVDLARKENLQAVEDMIQDPRIDYY